MSLQLQMQVHSRSHNYSLPYCHSFNGSRSKPQSSISNLAFRSSTVQQSLFPLFHKSNAFIFPTKKATPALQIVAAFSLEKDYVAESPAKVLRRILSSPGIHQSPACFDALSAKLVERTGFECCVASGMCYTSMLNSLLVLIKFSLSF